MGSQSGSASRSANPGRMRSIASSAEALAPIAARTASTNDRTTEASSTYWSSAMTRSYAPAPSPATGRRWRGPPGRGPRSARASGGAVDVLVGRVGVGEGTRGPRGGQREQRPERAALRVQALVVAHEVAAGVRGLVHVERTRQVVGRPGRAPVVRVRDPVVGGQLTIARGVLAEVVVRHRHHADVVDMHRRLEGLVGE